MITFLLSPGVKVRACFVALIGVVAEAQLEVQGEVFAREPATPVVVGLLLCLVVGLAA